MEVWGAEGGSSNWHGVVTLSGGKGGYSSGEKNINGNSNIYISVGRAGINSITNGTVSDVFNGGGGCYGYLDNSDHKFDHIPASGGGCTSIQISLINDGQLKRYVNQKDKVIIVAGGGGGAFTHRYEDSDHRWCGTGGAGGGLSGIVGDRFNGESSRSYLPTAGNQTDPGIGYMGDNLVGNAGFGYGMSTTDISGGSGGGGGGYYGGGSSIYGASAGGSGYIGGVSKGNTIAGNESMPSTTGGTETGHSGNGYCIITWHPSL